MKIRQCCYHRDVTHGTNHATYVTVLEHDGNASLDGKWADSWNKHGTCVGRVHFVYTNQKFPRIADHPLSLSRCSVPSETKKYFCNFNCY